MGLNIHLKKKSNRIFPVLLIVAGSFLVTYMVLTENEPGALPLLLVVIGAIWLGINKIKPPR